LCEDENEEEDDENEDHGDEPPHFVVPQEAEEIADDCAADFQ